FHEVFELELVVHLELADAVALCLRPRRQRIHAAILRRVLQRGLGGGGNSREHDGCNEDARHHFPLYFTPGTAEASSLQGARHGRWSSNNLRLSARRAARSARPLRPAPAIAPCCH